jgi:GNAT superfamily N-acetyltransferase
MSEIRIRKARAADVTLLFELIKEMSAYERLPLIISEQQLFVDGFGEAPLFQAQLAFVNEQVVGYALTHGCYADFEGRGLFLESLYVKEPFRGHDVAERLLSEVRRVARDQQCYGIVLNILRWNSCALAFFQKAGAAELDDRAIYLLPASAFRLK